MFLALFIVISIHSHLHLPYAYMGYGHMSYEASGRSCGTAASIHEIKRIAHCAFLITKLEIIIKIKSNGIHLNIKHMQSRAVMVTIAQ